MPKTSYLIALLGVLFILFGCPTGDDDDNDTSGDDDVADDDTGDDDAGDDDTGDDDTTGDDDSADDDSADDDTDGSLCEGNYTIESESDLNAITQCESITGTLRFDDQDWLTSLDLPCLTSVGEDLYINNNPALTSFDIPALTFLGGIGGGFVGIGNNPALTNLAGLSSLESVGYLYIYFNGSLTSLDGLSSLETVSWDLGIWDNDCLSQGEAEAFAAGLIAGGVVDVYDNGANYPCN